MNPYDNPAMILNLKKQEIKKLFPVCYKGKPFVEACATNNTDEVKRILKEESHLMNQKTEKGVNGLIAAIVNGHDKIVRLLLDNDYSIENSFLLGKFPSPLIIAILFARIRVMEMLLEKGAIAEEVCPYFEGTLLMMALELGITEACRLLIENQADVNSRSSGRMGLNPLLCAVRSGMLELVEMIYKAGAFVNQVQELTLSNALHFACNIDHFEMVKYLIDIKVTVNHTNIYGQAPIMVAAERSQSGECVRLLHKNGCDLFNGNKRFSNESPLHIACKHGNEAVVSYILEQMQQAGLAKLKVNARSNLGDTPLLMACGSNKMSLRVVEELVKHGASLDVKSRSNKTPLYLAVQTSHVDVVKFLCDLPQCRLLSDNELKRVIAGTKYKSYTFDDACQLVRDAKVRRLEAAEKMSQELLGVVQPPLKVTLSEAEKKKQKNKRRRNRRKEQKLVKRDGSGGGDGDNAVEKSGPTSNN